MYIPPWDLKPVSAYILNSASEPTELLTDEPLCRAKQRSFCSKGTKEVGKKKSVRGPEPKHNWEKTTPTNQECASD